MNSLAYPTVGLTRGRRKMLSARWVKAAALAGTMALGPVACGDSPGVESRHLEGVDAAARDQSGVTFEACVLAGLSVPAECGAVPVLTAEDGPPLALRVVRVRARGDSPRPDPIFILAGGPGQAGTRALPMMVERFRDEDPSRDIVILDRRGTGDSGGMPCEAASSPEELLQDRMPVDALLACLAAWPHEPQDFGTEAAAADLDRVRAALGYEQLNLVGGSYGTRQALVYARLFEPRVRSMVLDGVAPPQLALPSNFARDGQAALDALFRDCSADPGCAAAFPDLQEMYAAALQRADGVAGPLGYVHPRTRTRLEVPMSAQTLARLIRGALYSPDLTTLLPLAISRAAKGDFDAALGLAVALGDAPEPGIDAGLHLSVLCAEDIPRLGADAAMDEGLGAGLAAEYREACARWPVRPAAPEVAAPVQTDAPVLLLSGALDPVTPARQAALAAETLPRSESITVPGAAHGTLMSGCVMEIALKFIEARSLSGVDTSCVEETSPRRFFVDERGPSI